MVNVCAAAGAVKVKTIGLDSPPPPGVMVMVPVYGPLGVIVKFVEALLIAPPAGPVKLKPVAGIMTGSEAFEAKLAPTALVAVTVQVYVVPGVSPLTVIGLLVPVPVTPPGLQVAV